MGNKMAFSTQLAAETRKLIARRRRRVRFSRIAALRSAPAVAGAVGAAGEREWLIEQITTRDGHHLFFYPFEGRLVHLGLATLFSYRLSRAAPRSFSITVTDYGFGLLSPEPLSLSIAELAACCGVGCRTRYSRRAKRVRTHAPAVPRSCARAGLFSGLPGQGKSARQLQASSGLVYDVFAEYDPQNCCWRRRCAKCWSASSRHRGCSSPCNACVERAPS